ncbi:MAG: hypothetical protein KGM92_11720, partial [Acidobacteriota bacterium]|nr:hypothetical protein [Acidobacteriota bacterium]
KQNETVLKRSLIVQVAAQKIATSLDKQFLHSLLNALSTPHGLNTGGRTCRDDQRRKARIENEESVSSAISVVKFILPTEREFKESAYGVPVGDLET